MANAAITTVPVSGRLTGAVAPPLARLTAFSSSAARPTPAPRPTTEATRPITRASSSTLPNTWRRSAPRQRSSASSRVRWAIRMVNVL